MARDKGWFTEQGINLKSIGESRGSADTVQLVAVGTDTFGVADPSVTIASEVQGLRVKAVFSLINKSSLAVITPADKPIRVANDLRGKRFAVPASSSVPPLFQAVMKRNNLTENDVRMVTMDAGVVLTSLVAGQVDGVLLGLDGVPDLDARGFKYTYKTFADLGVNTPVSSVVTTENTIATNPDLVRRFVSVTQRAWEEAVRNPDAVVDACSRTKPTISRETYRKQLDIVLTLLASDATKGHPIGWGAAADWDSALQVQKEYRNLKTDQAATTFFTNDFLPTE
jgi:NitT/TauT family transport system substrate-binding protein